ncbi:hypothetical protein EON64_09170 [archaeon]|nr:MAG: hypothetical protein EON64_09170 [archaeon]
MVSASAYRPGDILIASDLKTIEIGNTDAEGRLTLADALVYAQTQIQDADIILDLATLTGASIEGLGPNVAALYSSSDVLRDQILAAARGSNELLWSMPLEESYRESIKSPIADLRNISGQKGGGSITAALFLREFLSSEFKGRWAHIDMAGPVWNHDSNGATGYGVKLLVDLVESLAKNREAEQGK